MVGDFYFYPPSISCKKIAKNKGKKKKTSPNKRNTK
jgi:hypothetical protein